ncbi:uncharacterized protein LOC128850457 [Cuculus canorus]|uniref:uncharacterized protein LOC128850457 n=1 Tax=Cuculus canorus TaxID=55661 RepID=UPI0023AB340F|nr:uncharacterized protein LOC128850457 [Cuculus canorus]
MNGPKDDDEVDDDDEVSGGGSPLSQPLSAHLRAAPLPCAAPAAAARSGNRWSRLPSSGHRAAGWRKKGGCRGCRAPQTPFEPLSALFHKCLILSRNNEEIFNESLGQAVSIVYCIDKKDVIDYATVGSFPLSPSFQINSRSSLLVSEKVKRIRLNRTKKASSVCISSRFYSPDCEETGSKRGRARHGERGGERERERDRDTDTDGGGKACEKVDGHSRRPAPPGPAPGGPGTPQDHPSPSYPPPSPARLAALDGKIGFYHPQLSRVDTFVGS